MSLIKDEITLYKVPFNKSMNARVQSLSTLLESLTESAITFTLAKSVKPSPQAVVRLPLEGARGFARSAGWTYARILHLKETEDGTETISVDYYWIDDSRWLGNETLELSLSYDSINSIIRSESLDSLLDSTTMIYREHRDRFVKAIKKSSLSYVLVPKYDKVDEGFSPLLYKKEDSIITDDRLSLDPSDHLIDVALLYTFGVTDPNAEKPKRVPLIAAIFEKQLPAVYKNAEGAFVESVLPAFSDVDYSFVSSETGGAIYKSVEYPYAPFTISIKNGRYYLPDFFANLFFWQEWASDLPAIWSNIWKATPVPSVELMNYINQPLHGTFAENYFVENFPYYDLEEERVLIDPKLATSQFKPHRFVYDSYTISINMEECDPADTAEGIAVDLSIWASTSMSSLFAFKAEPRQFSYEATEDYPLICYVNRNCEQLLINNEYLNYIRNGYNYDMKAKDLSTLSRVTGVAGGVVGGIVTAVANPAKAVTSLASASLGTANSLVNAIYGTISDDLNIERKKAQARSKGYSVEGSADLGIMKGLQTNKLRFITYEPDERIKKQLDDLFYYYGYKTNWQGIPDVTTRRWFNFLQCEPKFKNQTRNPLYELLRSKFEEGVTFFHKVTENGESKWNFERTKENLENGIYALTKGA